MAQIECLLWDFGDTLCDERFIWSSGPEWMEVYGTFDHEGLGARWCRGDIDTRAFAETLAKQMHRSAESIIAHMTRCCDAIHFFEATYEFFKSRQFPQAVVTVNPDFFSNVIVPACGLQGHCDVIVTSWQERTNDKRVLNRVAIQRLGLDCENHAALLIDNNRLNIDAWISAGGSGYHYRGDEQFAADVRKGVDLIAERLDRRHATHGEPST